MRMAVVLAAAAALLTAAAARAKDSDPSGDAGLTLTAGSGGYRRLTVFGDAAWNAASVDPYAWGQYSVDNDLRELSLGGGAWKELGDDARAKGGASLNFGRYLNSSDRGTSATFEAGAEKFLGQATLGAEDRLTAGSVGSPASPGVAGRNPRDRARGAGSGSDSYVYNELAGYARLPAGAAWLGLRASVGFSSYGRAITDETLSARFPVARNVWATTAVTAEQGTATSLYVSVGGFVAF